MPARAGVYRETDLESIGFLTRRGFVEVQRGWQSRLDVAGFEFERFAGYVGMSAMHRPLAEPGIIHQGLTGVLCEDRGRGIAMALKLQTVRYARDHGYREIRTWNDARNRAMLRINEAMGFVKQPASVNFERSLDS